jgi:predicted Zn-dependent protease
MILGQHTGYLRSAGQLTCVCLFHFLVLGSVPAEESPLSDVSLISTGELEKQAAFAISGQEHAKATTLLAELVERLGESRDPQVQTKVESFRYFLGLGYIFNNQWPEAALAFESFLKAHPKSNRYRKVLELHGQALAQSKRYTEAAEVYQKLLELKLTEAENFPIMEKLASCYMRDQKWTDAIPVLQTMLQKSWAPEQREQSVVWLAQSYIECGQGAKVVELLPDMLTKATGCSPLIRMFSRSSSTTWSCPQHA